jgi:hypothetical protein
VLVEALPDLMPAAPQSSDQALAQAMDWSFPRKDYYPPRPTATKKVIYFNELLLPDNLVPAGVNLLAVQDLVLVPKGSDRNIRLIVQLGAVNSKRMGDLRSCFTKVSVNSPEFQAAVDIVQKSPGGVRWVCADREIKAATVTEAIFGDAPLLRSAVELANPGNQQLDYPIMIWGYGTKDKLDAGGDAYREQSLRIDRHNPALLTTVVTETRV